MNARPEITWSIMHPVRPDPAYMQDVIAHAAKYHVDSFEVCGEVHSSLGGVDGAIRFRDYPDAAAGLDLPAIERNIGLLRGIAGQAHASGRPLYYWHREIMVPRRVVERIPGLLDEHGEFDLLGAAYQALLRAKLREFFENVPEMDGLVLTLTESDYSVIHNSDPQRYPPAQVVAHVVETFAKELAGRRKRFILRSFGSIAEDYESILAGAAVVGTGFPLELETKITPYDFSPFLPLNPYLRRTGECAHSAEYDSIGEFLGAGFLPAADPERVIECVNYARQQGVSRHVIRIDRIGHATFASAQAINLLAFDRAIAQPGITAAAIWREWAETHWPGCQAEMTAIMQRGIEMVKKTHFIDGHVIFHAFPIQPDLKWIKACGILSVFRPGVALGHHQGMWGILTDRTTPHRASLLREKDEAVAMADEGWAAIARLRGRLPEAEYDCAEIAWRRATVVTRAIRHWCRCLCAYFEDMEQRRAGHPQLAAALAAARTEFEAWLKVPLTFETVAGAHEPAEPANEYGGLQGTENSIESAYLRPIWRLLQLLLPEYAAEFEERRRWLNRPDMVDHVVCGGLIDDIRVRRYMHASHTRLLDGRPARTAGNRVFPNGFIEVRLDEVAAGDRRLVIAGDAGPRQEFLVTVNHQSKVGRFSPDREFTLDLGESGGNGAATPGVTIRIQKVGAEYPSIFAVAVLGSTS